MADDTDVGGPIVSGEVAPAPSDTRPEVIADERSRDQLVREQFNAGLGLTAHGTEDATDFIRERETQERFLEGKDLSPGQYKEWHERTLQTHRPAPAVSHLRNTRCQRKASPASISRLAIRIGTHTSSSISNASRTILTIRKISARQ